MPRRLNVLLLFVVIAGSACSSADSKIDSAEIYLNGKVVKMSGTITDKLADKLITVLKAHPEVNKVQVNSAGGDARAGMRIGHEIIRRSLVVFVDGLCASACAQYVFLAGKRAMVRPGSVIAFHSSPSAMQAVLSRSPLSDRANLFRGEAEEERRFYRKLGVREDIGLIVAAKMQPLCVGLASSRESTNPWHFGVGWAYSAFVPTPKQLRELGAHNISGDWPSSQGLTSDLAAVGLSKRFRPAFAPSATLESKISDVPMCGRGIG